MFVFIPGSTETKLVTPGQEVKVKGAMLRSSTVDDPTAVFAPPSASTPLGPTRTQPPTPGAQTMGKSRARDINGTVQPGGVTTPQRTGLIHGAIQNQGLSKSQIIGASQNQNGAVAMETISVIKAPPVTLDTNGTTIHKSPTATMKIDKGATVTKDTVAMETDKSGSAKRDSLSTDEEAFDRIARIKNEAVARRRMQIERRKQVERER